MRRTLPIALSTSLTAALTLATLVGCSAAPAPSPTESASAECEPTASGPASDAVRATGDFGGVLTIDAEYPLTATTTERTVLIEGEGGDKLDDGLTGTLSYVLVNGTTGELIENSHDVFGEPLPFPYQAGTSMPGLESALRCATAGSRIAAVIPPADGFGDAGVAEIGLEPGQSIILVADIVSVAETPATSDSGTTPEGPVDLPTPTSWTGDIPAVDLATDPPTVTIPDSAPPAELLLTVLAAGDGEPVPNPATVTIDYVGVSWDTGEVFDSSYSRGTPATFGLSGVIPGFAAAIAGQSVGSTVLVSIPPALAYGTTDTSSHALAGQTLVFLITIVGYE